MRLPCGFTPPTHVEIDFHDNEDGVAYTVGNHVVCMAKYFRKHRDDVGAVVHELVHVVQQYGNARCPGWIIEGIPDYIRFYDFEPATKRPKPDPAKAKFSDSYRTSASFLNWVQTTFDKDLVRRLNATCRQHRYNERVWAEWTGETLHQLNEGWLKSLPKRPPTRVATTRAD